MIGWIGSILLGACGIPELYRTIKDNRCHVGWGMLLMWLIGEILVFIHVFKEIQDVALLFNYGLNIAILIVMVYYKIRR